MSHGDCKVNTKGYSVSNIFLQLCVCYIYMIHTCVYLQVCLVVEGVEKLQFSLASEEAVGSEPLKEKLSKNIYTAPKGTTCSMEQFRNRNVHVLKNLSGLLLGIAS